MRAITVKTYIGFARTMLQLMELGVKKLEEDMKNDRPKKQRK